MGTSLASSFLNSRPGMRSQQGTDHSFMSLASSMLVGVNKVGMLKPDANGYREMVLGALNTFNSRGEFYDLEGSVKCFQEGSPIFRAYQKGCLYGEYWHPDLSDIQHNPRLTDQQKEEMAMARTASVKEKFTSHHIKKIWVDYDRIKDRNGRPIAAIIGLVIPSGPYGETLEKQLDNPDENVYFSLRGICDMYRQRGIWHRVLTYARTFDHVNEGGIYEACKYKSPALEEYTDGMSIHPSTIETMLLAAKQEDAILSSLSNEAVDDLAFIKQRFSEGLFIRNKNQLPPTAHWGR